MNELIMLAGPSGSGKTYFLRKLLRTERFKDHTSISLDEQLEATCAMFDLTYQEGYQLFAKDLYENMLARLQTLSKSKFPVILDFTNLTKRGRTIIMSLFPNYEVSCYWNKEAHFKHKPPEKVAMWMHKIWEEPSLQEGFVKVSNFKNLPLKSLYEENQ